MANRETYPAAIFPMRGDLSAEAGATTVTVIGIQTIPVSATAPIDSQSLIAVSGVWTPESVNASITVNLVPMSDDYDIGVNLPLGTTLSPVLVNGV